MEAIHLKEFQGSPHGPGNPAPPRGYFQQFTLNDNGLYLPYGVDSGPFRGGILFFLPRYPSAQTALQPSDPQGTPRVIGDGGRRAQPVVLRLTLQTMPWQARPAREFRRALRRANRARRRARARQDCAGLAHSRATPPRRAAPGRTAPKPARAAPPSDASPPPTYSPCGAEQSGARPSQARRSRRLSAARLWSLRTPPPSLAQSGTGTRRFSAPGRPAWRRGEHACGPRRAPPAAPFWAATPPGPGRCRAPRAPPCRPVRPTRPPRAPDRGAGLRGRRRRGRGAPPAPRS